MSSHKEHDVLRATLREVASRSRQDQLLADVLSEDLALLRERHGERLRDVDGVLAVFEAIRGRMTQSEKDAFFRAVLKGFRGITEASRTEIREIVGRYINRTALGADEGGVQNPTKRLPR